MSLNIDDTIASSATPPGRGALAVIRLSGPETFKVLSRVFYPVSGADSALLPARTVHYGDIRSNGRIIDEVIVSVMRNPASYTGEDMAEITCHGGTCAPASVLEALICNGARPAGPGEFTMRAYLNGKMDLSQAEAVNQVISARSEKALQGALRILKGGLGEKLEKVKEAVSGIRAGLEARIEFGETEDIGDADTGAENGIIEAALSEISVLVKESSSAEKVSGGFSTVICGPPNAGKSSLFNLLSGSPRSIVNPQPGTTRDSLEKEIFINGYIIKLYDTAGLGLRDASEIDRQAAARAREEISGADLLIYLIDGSAGPSGDDSRMLENFCGKAFISAVNKSDLGPFGESINSFREKFRSVMISCRDKSGIGELKERIEAILSREEPGGLMINSRQRLLLETVELNLQNALFRLKDNMSELASFELAEAERALGEIDGRLLEADLLDRIFSGFCIGK